MTNMCAHTPLLTALYRDALCAPRLSLSFVPVQALKCVRKVCACTARAKAKGGSDEEVLLRPADVESDAPGHLPAGVGASTHQHRGNAAACVVILAKTILGAGAPQAQRV
jgi:hypothetical protein